MRTIHFAHWAMVNNKSRLMFFSNFDQTWESYLDDFIEKAHAGLTLAWCCGVGFPPTRFLVKDGASHGRQFKEWARHSMTVSRFWYSAYKDLTAEQIERNFRIAMRAPQANALGQGGRRMDQRPVSAAPQKGPPSWRLASPHDKRPRGMVVSGFASCPPAARCSSNSTGRA
jgi:hypothetical protein